MSNWISILIIPAVYFIVAELALPRYPIKTRGSVPRLLCLPVLMVILGLNGLRGLSALLTVTRIITVGQPSSVLPLFQVIVSVIPFFHYGLRLVPRFNLLQKARLRPKRPQ